MFMRLKKISSDQSGVTIVEVVLSAVLMVVIAISAFAVLQSSSRASAQERHQAQGYAIAQDDQARLRALKIPVVSHLSQTTTRVQDGTTYTITSTGTPAIDRTATASCDSGNSSADYIAITSKVTWQSMGTRPPVVVESIIAPPNGSLDPDRGALAISVLKGDGTTGYPGITIAGSGTSTFSGTTGPEGCLIFGDLPAGSYTITPSNPGVVDKDGKPPAAIPTTVVGQSSNKIALQYDRPGTATVSFQTKVGTRMIPSSADAISVYNTGMTAARTFGTAGGTRASSRTATSLFPFSSPYSIYAGSCTTNNPGSGAALAVATVPVGGTVNVGTPITLPALNLTVYNGSKIYGDLYGSYYYGVPIANARVTITDTAPGCNVKRVTTTNSMGKLADPGLPWGTYDICVSAPDGLDGTVRKFTSSGVVVKDPANPKSLSVYVYDGTPAAAGCP